MELTTEVLAGYKGGQIEIQNQNEGYLYRGEIADAEVKDGDLVVWFNWQAKGESYPPFPTRWVKEENRNFVLSLMEGFTSIRDIGPGAEGGSNRILILSLISSEIIILYPPDGSKLDPANVED